MAFLTAEQARQKANESESQYKLLRHEVFTEIENVANQGKYKLEVIKNTPYSLATRLTKELRSYDYLVDCDMIGSNRTNDNKRDMHFNINWKY